ncbi:MAG: hypothetical protein P1U87_20435 [Verrucomicrobiales bacterium]|nr:hypothetical protein [Verrucomicrobiales bacterium]
MNAITTPEVIHFQPDGTGAGLYTEVIDLKEIGVLDVSRASNVEFNPATQQWEVFDYTGHRVFTDPSRETCLRWEREYFNDTPTH